ncbi:MAG: Uma2 family endonuclease [Flammeovirgaceae bacterium]
METNYSSPPRTIMEVYKMLPEGTLAELIDGQIFMSPTPNTIHQRTSRILGFKIHQFVVNESLGEIFFAPLDVYLDTSKNAVQPDIIFVSKTNSSQPIDDEPYHGVPDLLVEILSPSNNIHDLITKKNLYEKFSVLEYWIVDPYSKEVIVYQFKNNSYQLAGKEIGRIYSPLFDHTFEF